MADRPDRVVLLAIHPEHAEQILGGTKQVEFRRRWFAADVTQAILYATQPLQRLVGWFTVEHVDRDRPVALWSRYRDVGGVQSAAFFGYFQDAKVGYAIKIAGAGAFQCPRALSDLGVLHPPRSLRYVDPALARTLAIGGGR